VKRSTEAAPFDAVPRASPEAHTIAGLRGFSRRMALAVAGGSFAGTLAAFGDALFVRSTLEGAASPGFFAVARIDTGLVAPIALAVGAAVGLFDLLVQPDRALSPAELVRRLDATQPALRRRLAPAIVVFILALPLFATAIAHIARTTMGASGSNIRSGLVLGGLTLIFFVALAALALSAGEWFASRGRGAAEGLRPSHALVGGAAYLAVVIFVWVKIGSTSGQGGWLGIWGVFRRPELDLRAPSLLALVALGAWLVPHLVGKTPVLALTIGTLPLIFTLEAAMGLGDRQDVAAALEQGAPLGKLALRALRSATDRDHDGYSALFGGGDCNDADPRINPGAQDVPGNGIDEDCSGADAPVTSPTPGAAAVPTKTSDLFPKGLNVILITIDTLRADLGFAGYPKPVTPNLDAFAARSVVFDRAYSLASYTGKSLGPLLIGKYPSETHRGWGHFNKFSTEDLFVAERLQKAGIHTVSVQAHWYMGGPNHGMARGFDVVDKSAQPPPGTDQDNDATITGGKLTDAALRVLGNPDNTTRRFFTWIHYLDPHSEYAKHPGAPEFGPGMRAPYDGEVWYVDQQIGRVLDFVSSQPWAKNTAIVVTSDHGEAFAEHHMIRHGVEIWEELVRVPLIVHVPGVAPHRIAVPRGAIDVCPTILDLFEVSPPVDGGPFDFVSGHSLAADVVMPPGYEPAPRDVLVDMPPGPYNDERRALLHAGKKLYVAGGVRFTVFDLERDPGEKSASDDKALMADMKARYQAVKSQLREVTVKPVPKEVTSP
jgi:arylsulfatase A-like enzyme